MSSVAKRYARAAVGAALEKEGEAGVEKLAQGISSFRDACRASIELRELLRNPALNAERDTTLGTLLAKLGASATTVRLIQLLAKNDRVDELEAVADAIENEADNRAGRVRARVRSAMPLTEAHVQKLGKTLEKRFKKPVVISWTHEPHLLGGLVAQVGDLTLDTSLSHQLDVLREQLAAATV